MINYFSPINYYTGINPIIFSYYSGIAFGNRPENFFGFNFSPAPSFSNYNGLNGSLFSFGNSYSTNPFQTILNATNQVAFSTNTDSIYNFGSSFGSGIASRQDTNIQTGNFNSQFPTTTIATNTIKNTSDSFKKNTFKTSELAKNAQKYLGVSEANYGHLKFMINPECKKMDPYNEEWCTDFVTYVTNETYKKQGFKTPSWFGSHDVATLKRQSIAHNKFIDTTTKTDKGKFISQNIKPGDIVILNQNKASHTGFVTKVNSDGSFETIEGNVGDPGGKGIGMVTTNNYYAEEERLSGFIRLT